MSEIDLINGYKIRVGSIGTYKVCNVLGDSQTESNAKKTKPYHTWLKDLLALQKVNNYGLSGSCLTVGSNPNVLSLCERFDTMSDDADLVIVWAGVNDRWFNSTLGEFSDTSNTTVYGAVKYLCNGLLNKYPTSKILFITPCNEAGGATNANTNGISIDQIAEAIIKVCNSYGIETYDARTRLGIYPAIKANADKYAPDKLHLGDYGHKLLGYNLAQMLKTTFHEVDSEPTSNNTLQSISAVYSGGDVPVGTSVNDLTGITVTGHYTDGSAQAVTGYTLSGMIAEGSNTITVSYDGKTCTFTVVATAANTNENPVTHNGVQVISLEALEGDLHNAESYAHYVNNGNYQNTAYIKGYSHTGYIELEPNATYNVYGTTVSIVGCYFDADFNFIKNANISDTAIGGDTTIVMSGAKYFMFNGLGCTYPRVVKA